MERPGLEPGTDRADASACVPRVPPVPSEGLLGRMGRYVRYHGWYHGPPLGGFGETTSETPPLTLHPTSM